MSWGHDGVALRVPLESLPTWYHRNVLLELFRDHGVAAFAADDTVLYVSHDWDPLSYALAINNPPEDRAGQAIAVQKAGREVAAEAGYTIREP